MMNPSGVVRTPSIAMEVLSLLSKLWVDRCCRGRLSSWHRAGRAAFCRIERRSCRAGRRCARPPGPARSRPPPGRVSNQGRRPRRADQDVRACERPRLDATGRRAVGDAADGRCRRADDGDVPDARHCAGGAVAGGEGDEVSVVRLSNRSDEAFGDYQTARDRIDGYHGGVVPFSTRDTPETVLKMITKIARQLESLEHRRKVILCVGLPVVCDVEEPAFGLVNPLWPFWSPRSTPRHERTPACTLSIRPASVEVRARTASASSR
jgi:hypothetical protein